MPYLSFFEFLKKIRKPLDEKIKESKRIIRKYKENCFVCWSGGKDSTVMIHLITQLDLDIPILFVDTGVEYPQTVRYVKRMVKEFGIQDNFFLLKNSINPLKLPRTIKFGRGEEKFCEIIKMQYFEKFREEHGFEKKMVADIWDETFDRFAVIYEFGEVVRLPNIIKVLPLAWWSEEDIWKYYEIERIPLNPLYKQGFMGTTCYVCPYPSLSQELNFLKIYPKLFTKKLKYMRRFPHFYKKSIRRHIQAKVGDMFHKNLSSHVRVFVYAFLYHLFRNSLIGEELFVKFGPAISLEFKDNEVYSQTFFNS
ncbi:MAG: phosphoadenosine phosphosulfate reductase family protein [Candidatus Aenigmarchaeota archaeon]|nr:phosphoadenosine phosphosulfate reductase family protein [Candidatus Aenigmarchaeota archaeon]